MTDADDEALRRSNPVPHPRAAFPSDHPAAQAFAEEVLAMPVAVDPGPPHAAQRTAGRPARLLAAAAAVAALAVGALTLAGGQGGAPARRAAPPPTRATAPPGAASSASCAFVYGLATLAQRELAFDGTVVAVAGDEVTFSVHRWYRGGEGAETTLRGAEALAGLTSAGTAVDLSPGARLLVAGDDGFAWSCGFTQPWSEAVAGQWAEALR